MIANATASNPTIEQSLLTPKKGDFNYAGNDGLNERLNLGFKDINADWGTSLDDVHFINIETGSEGKDGYYNNNELCETFFEPEYQGIIEAVIESVQLIDPSCCYTGWDEWCTDGLAVKNPNSPHYVQLWTKYLGKVKVNPHYVVSEVHEVTNESLANA